MYALFRPATASAVALLASLTSAGWCAERLARGGFASSLERAQDVLRSARLLHPTQGPMWEREQDRLHSSAQLRSASPGAPPQMGSPQPTAKVYRTLRVSCNCTA